MSLKDADDDDDDDDANKGKGKAKDKTTSPPPAIVIPIGRDRGPARLPAKPIQVALPAMMPRQRSVVLPRRRTTR